MTQQGVTPPVKQISIVTKQADPVTAITEILGAAGINLLNLSHQQMGEHGFISLIAEDCDHTLALLGGAGFKAVTDETILIKWVNQAGSLAEIARTISDAGVSVRSLTLLDISAVDDIVAISSSDNARVRALFEKYVIN